MRTLLLLAVLAPPAAALDMEKFEQFGIEARLLATTATVDTLRAWADAQDNPVFQDCIKGRVSYGDIFSLTMAGQINEKSETLQDAILNALEDHCGADLSGFR